MESLSARRTLRRVLRGGKSVTPVGKGRKKPQTRTEWTYEGISSDSDSVKAAMKNERQERGLTCRYVRGLRVYAKDEETTKFVDRDVNGSINIGLLWLCDNLEGRSRPSVFERPKKNEVALKRHVASLPAQNSGSRVEKDHTAGSVGQVVAVEVSQT